MRLDLDLSRTKSATSSRMPPKHPHTHTHKKSYPFFLFDDTTTPLFNFLEAAFPVLNKPVIMHLSIDLFPVCKLLL